jgi:glycerophosphoryl diester phosphodiesterase
MPGFFTGPTPRVFGHRGAAGLAPENTLPSFALALALGCDILELDVRGTHDGMVVVFHDETLERTTNGSGPISDRSLAQLESLDAGYHFTRDGRDFAYRGHGLRIPTFEAVLRAFPLAYCNVEIKQDDPPMVEEVIAVVRKLNAEHRVLLAAEHDAIMKRIRLHAEEIATSACTGEVADFVNRFRNRELGDYKPVSRALQIPARYGDVQLVTADSVAAAHRVGLEVHVWTINDPEEMSQLLHAGVDGIISDLPGLARVVVDQHARAK